jgi:predicted nucleic acid-binding protein
MLVVSDATPLNMLVRSGLVHILPALFETIIIPPAVHRELSHPSTPAPVREWIQSPPAWLRVRVPSQPLTHGPKGAGEREAIALACELKAELLLADDKAARATAASLGIAVTGTLGVLEQAAARNLVSLRTSVDIIRSQGLFLTDQLIEDALHRDAQRRVGETPPGPGPKPGP